MAWAPDYTTTAHLKSYLKIDDDDDDVFIAQWISTASRNVDHFCGRQFGTVAGAEERFYTPIWDSNEGRYYVAIDDLHSATGLSVEDDDGIAITEYTLLPRNAAVKGRPYERLRLGSYAGELAITSPNWGWSAVPPSVVEGLELQAARLAKRRDSPFGVAGSPANGGSELRLLAALDPDFKTSLRPFQRTWWAA